MPLRRPILCFVTDRRRLSNPSLSSLVDAIAIAARAGVDLIQVRERDLADRELHALSRAAAGAIAGTPAALVVNDRVDVALTTGAQGVHLRANSAPSARVRAMTPDGFLIGRSVHSEGEAHAAGPVDYLVFGAVFRTRSKPADHPVTGVDTLRRVCRAVSIPVLAIGGITEERAGAVFEAGAAGVAAMGLFTDVLRERGDREKELAAMLDRVRQRFDRGSQVV